MRLTWPSTRVSLLLAWLAVVSLLVGCSSTHHSTPSAAAPSSAAGVSVSNTATRAPLPTSAAAGAPERDEDWPAYHGNAGRTGVSAAMPAATGHLTAIPIALQGTVYASPIVVGTKIIVATEANLIYGLGPDGSQLWKVSAGSPTPRSALPCGNIDPLGITGTPVYDPASGSVFVVASLGTTVRHELIALDPASGAFRWRRSVDLPGVDAQAMQQRAALTVLNGRVWVAFGGLAGDCGDYKGRVIGVPVGGSGDLLSYTVPTTREAGIWTPPGPVVAAASLLVSVGNGESVDRYDYSDSILRIADDTLVDSFSPRSWASDNAADLDLGSLGPTVVGSQWVFAAGKSGTAYVLRQAKLGGIGGQVSQAPICKAFGGTAVLADVVYVPCTDGLRAVEIDDGGTMHVRWHAADNISGSPVVGGGRVYSVDAAAGVLYALDPATGRVREHTQVGVTSRFATPAIMRDRVLVPTLTGVSITSTR